MSALSLTHTTRPRLGHLRQDELAELFSTLATADINALAGHQWHGRLLAPFAAQHLPRPLLLALSAFPTARAAFGLPILSAISE